MKQPKDHGVATSNRQQPESRIPSKPGHNPTRYGSEQVVSRIGGFNLQQYWGNQNEIKIKVLDLPRDISTLEVAEIFAGEGHIVHIHLPTNPDGSGKGVAFVVFSPPPSRDFWSRSRYDAKLPSRKLHTKLRLTLAELPEPKLYKGLYTGDQYPETMTLSAESLGFGTSYDEHTMMLMYSTRALPSFPITVRQSLRFRELEVRFPVRFRNAPGTPSKPLK